MSQIKFTNTNLILNYIVKFEISMERLKNIPLPYTHKNELHKQLLIEDIAAMGELVGRRVGLQVAQQVEEGKIYGREKVELLILSNYRSALEFARSYSPEQFIPPSAELLLHINKLLMNKILEEWEYGKLRGFSEKPNEIYDNWYQLRDFYPNLQISSHLEKLLSPKFREESNLHTLIHMGIILYELIDKAPLYCGNMVSAIVLIHALTKHYGYNPDGYFPIAKSINQLGSEFNSAFKLSKGNRDLTSFLEAFLYSLSLHMIQLENRYNTTFNQRVKNQSQLYTRFNRRQIKLIEYMENIDRISRKEYLKMMGVSFMTAYRDLQDLLEAGYIVSKGVGRGTYYVLKNRPEKLADDKPKLEVLGEVMELS